MKMKESRRVSPIIRYGDHGLVLPGPKSSQLDEDVQSGAGIYLSSGAPRHFGAESFLKSCSNFRVVSRIFWKKSKFKPKSSQ